MITNPILYLFTLAFIATFFFLLESKTSWKIFKFVPAVIYIFGVSFLLKYFLFFDTNNEIVNLNKLAIDNLLFAMLFLLFLNPARTINNIKRSINVKKDIFGMGCSCTLGRKNYWFLVLLSIIVSLSIQTLTIQFDFSSHYIDNFLLIILVSYILSHTNIKNINGIDEISKSMFYMLSGLASYSV